jgi:hypothetical protein
VILVVILRVNMKFGVPGLAVVVSFFANFEFLVFGGPWD